MNPVKCVIYLKTNPVPPYLVRSLVRGEDILLTLVSQSFSFASSLRFEEKGFDVEWDVELYGELLTTGGGKERMTRHVVEFGLIWSGRG